MRCTFFAVLAMGSAAMLPAAQAVAQSCTTPGEQAALVVRHIQTQLMVGALACRGSRNFGQRDNYSRFVLENRQALAGHALTLRAYFARLYGSDAQSRLDRYVTGVANAVSRTAGQQESFCTRIADFGQSMASSLSESETPMDLAVLAPIQFKPSQPLCSAETRASIAE